MSSTPFHEHTAFLFSGLIDPGKCQISTRRYLPTPRGGVENPSEDLTAVASGCSPLCLLVLASPTRPCSRQVNLKSPQGASRHQIPGIGEMMKESEKSQRSGTCTKPSPVCNANFMELLPQQTSQERTHMAPFNNGLGNGPDPEVNVVRRPVDIHKLSCDDWAFQHHAELNQVLGLREATIAPPRIVPWKGKPETARFSFAASTRLPIPLSHSFPERALWSGQVGRSPSSPTQDLCTTQT